MHAIFNSLLEPFIYLSVLINSCTHFFQTKDEKYFIHNHLSFTVKYHKDDNLEHSRIVGFEVNPHRFTS
jgi:hypothetical protein